jgi:CDP-paratose 2-epimerase
MVYGMVQRCGLGTVQIVLRVAGSLIYPMNILITGSSGLIGSALVELLDPDHKVIGIDNDSRKTFFGEEGSTLWNLNRLLKKTQNFTSMKLDICNRIGINYLFSKNKFDVVIHAAAQPAHDYSYKFPLVDFEVNTVGTMNLLEATRQHCPEATFVFFSTSKVYGVNVNNYSFKEFDTRIDYAHGWMKGVSEECSIDQTLHSQFGADKAAADLLAQEYGLYFGLKTTILRPGCLSGQFHSAVPLHGFLSYLIKCVLTGTEYKIYDDTGGKRVRDNIDSYDVATLVNEVIKAPPPGGTVYNIGGEKENSISIVEALTLASRMTGRASTASIHPPRTGDHIVYISDMTKFRHDYSSWQRKYNLDMMFENMIKDYKDRGD